MTKVIEMPKINELEKVVYNPFVKSAPAHLTEFKIMRIKEEENYTRIDFLYCNGSYAWVQIDPNSFIRPVGSEVRFPLIKVQGIPLTLQKYYFRNVNETINYNLYFAALPKSVTSIDIIEKEVNTPAHNYFNFYGVSMETIKKRPIAVGN